MNHQLLNAIGVGNIDLDNIMIIAKDHGYSGKLTGAGGGGCALIYVLDTFEEARLIDLKLILTEKGYDCYEVSVGVPGLAFHDINLERQCVQNTKESDISWIRLPISRICT